MAPLRLGARLLLAARRLQLRNCGPARWPAPSIIKLTSYEWNSVSMSKRPAPIDLMTTEQKARQDVYVRSFVAHMEVVERRRVAVVSAMDELSRTRGLGDRTVERSHLQNRLAVVQRQISRMGTVYKGLVTGRIAPWM